MAWLDRNFVFETVGHIKIATILNVKLDPTSAP